ncbi:MAG: amidohydrolase family protein [Caldicoprobacterales bacterium]|jgi:predicted TIM-barrel fold metal-dependent hydrolase|nr:amidohydrolase [Clostridiales bacterium]
MLIDIHTHIWGPPGSPPCSSETIESSKKDLIKAGEKYKIDRIYVSGLYSHYPDEEEIAGLNWEVAKFIKEEPKLIGGFCYVNPAHSNAMDVLKKGIEEQNMEGMKLWVATFCDDERVFPLVEQCILYNIPILIHAFHKAVGQLEHESLAPNVANLARRYPEAKLIIAHLGGNAYYGIKPIRNCPNVWVDFSGSLFRRDDIDYTKKLIGADRIVFGTDMPGASFYNNLGQVEDGDLTEEEKEKIYYKNALRLLDRRERIL